MAVINLLCRKSRRGRILKLCAQLKKTAEESAFPITSVNLIEAVDGVSQSFDQLEQRHGLKPFSNWPISDPESKYPSSWRVPQTSGGIASGLSHLDIAAIAHSFEWLTQSLDAYILVLEDDCYVTTDAAYAYFVKCLEEANATCPDWDMLLLGAGGHRPDIAQAIPIPGASEIEIAGFSYLTTMYWLSPRGVGKLLKNRTICVEHCLAFDELHNALSGLSSRGDVNSVFAACEPLKLLSSLQQMVKQDPHDGVHDTTVIASNSKRYVVADDDDVPPPFLGMAGQIAHPPPTDLEKTVPFRIPVEHLKLEVNWYRRRVTAAIPLEVLVKDLGVAKPKLLKRRPVVPLATPAVEVAVDEVAEVKVPQKRFALMAALMKVKRDKARDGLDDHFPQSFDFYEQRTLIRE